MYPNKAPPKDAPMMIPGEESTRGNGLLYLNLHLLRLCLLHFEKITKYFRHLQIF